MLQMYSMRLLFIYFEAVISSGWVVIYKWPPFNCERDQECWWEFDDLFELFAVHLEPEREQTLD